MKRASASRKMWEDFHRIKQDTSHSLEWPDEYVVRFAKRLSQIPEIQKVLDMNCGAGRHTALLAELGFRTVALDLSGTALQQARQLLKKRGLKATLKQGSSLRLPFKSGQFDALVAWRTLHVFNRDDIPKVISEMRRVVRPNGYILLSTRSDRNIYDEERVGKIVHRPTEMTLSQIKQVCNDLNIIQIELSESTSDNRRLRDSYWVVFAQR